MISTAYSSLVPFDLTVGPFLTNPLGFGDKLPLFSWKLPLNEQVKHQTAYRIVCASDPKMLSDSPDLWDSGWISSNQSLFIDYQGSPLQSRKRVYWKVRLKSGDDILSDWSDSASFELSLLNRTDWSAQWIHLHEESSDESAPPPYFRKKFALKDKPIEKARVYASAKGVFELHLNGQRVSDEYFAPEWTAYHVHSHFVTYDLTDSLKSGVNVIGAVLGETWYSGVMGLGGKDITARNRYGKTPELLIQIEITYTDGTRQTIITDDTWRGQRGPIIASNIYNGEHYDANQELGEWLEPNFDDHDWEHAQSKKIEPSVQLTAKPNQPIRIIEELFPQSVTEITPGTYVFDLGQNMVGWPRLKIQGCAGKTYTLRFAEMLNDDGTLYTDNYRSAKSTDSYTCKDNSFIEWEPKFTFHGFRYVELSVVPKDVAISTKTITGVVLHNDMPQTGSFVSSDNRLNQLQSNIRWGQKGNFFAVPTDCPQRDERLGWTGDAQVFCATANYNFNTLAFFEKWCSDLRDSQYENGGIPFYVPTFPLVPHQSSTGWGDACVIVPWEVYRSFGYKKILSDNYEMMVHWLRYYEEHEATKSLIHNGFSFGDWLQPYTRGRGGVFGETDVGLIGTAYFARCADLVSKVADILEKPAEAIKHHTQFEAIRKAFQTRFFDSEGKQIAEYETQAGYLLAIAFGLLDKDMEAKAFQHLVQLIDVEAKGHLRTGFLGTPVIMSVLTQHGRTDLAFDLLFRESYPGWFYSIQQGATTMWERWNSYSKEDGFGDDSMNSFNHYAYGAIGEWMYGTIAGLSLKEAGYRTILFSPHPNPHLNSAKAKLETPYGLARSEWNRVGDVIHYQITIPPNTTGLLGTQVLRPGTYEFKMTAEGTFEPIKNQAPIPLNTI